MISMETTIIIVSERKEKAGTGKNGKPYLLTTLIAQTGEKYSGFNIARDIQPGHSVKLYATPNQGYKNSFNIETIVEHDANPNQVILPPKGQAVGRENAAVKPSPSIPDLTPQLQAIWIANAYEALKLAKLDPDVEHDLLVLLVKQYGEDRMNKVIDAQQNRRYGR